MKTFFGVEANYLIEEVPELATIIKAETSIFDYHENIFLFEKKADAIYTEVLLKEAELFENVSQLCLINKGEKGATFLDFGMESEQGTYLFTDLLCAFCIVRGSTEAIQMASLQFQEHLIYSTKDEERGFIHFTELHLQNLIKGIANAYDIEVSFLDLDK